VTRVREGDRWCQGDEYDDDIIGAAGVDSSRAIRGMTRCAASGFSTCRRCGCAAAQGWQRDQWYRDRNTSDQPAL